MSAGDAYEDGHGYVSTACWHGLHARCRLVCKFCTEPCLCQCHRLPRGANNGRP